MRKGSMDGTVIKMHSAISQRRAGCALLAVCLLCPLMTVGFLSVSQCFMSVARGLTYPLDGPLYRAAEHCTMHVHTAAHGLAQSAGGV